MSNKAVFLDRDGTINIDKNYLYRIEDFEYKPRVIEGLRLLQNRGFLLVIITNQSGIARGIFTEEQYLSLNDWMIKDLARKGINIAASYYCPHHPEAVIPQYRKKCKCRKPGIELFEKAIADLDIDQNNSYAIGDRERDLFICVHRKIKGFLIDSDNYRRIDERIYAIPGGLYEAAERITREENGKMDQ